MAKKLDNADKLIDEMIAGKTPEEIVGEGGLLDTLTKRVYERALESERTSSKPSRGDTRRHIQGSCSLSEFYFFFATTV